LVELFPPREVDFDPHDVPLSVVVSLSEAIRCHAAKCYIAAAIMIRKSMEEICREFQVPGATLSQKIENLAKTTSFSDTIVGSMDALRVFGNSAAHETGEAFDDITEEEMETMIELTKAILKEIYQHRYLKERMQRIVAMRANRMRPQNF